MQPTTDGPRAGFTLAQVAYLIENAPGTSVSMGMELIDQSLNIADDISDAVRTASISRSNYANIHASLTFSIDRELDWGNSIVRPYMEFTGPTSATSTVASTMRFYRGAFITDTPDEDMSQTPSSFDVTGYDVLSYLDDPIGDAYSVDAGVGYLAQVEAIFLLRGFTQYVIDQDSTAAVLPSPKTYTLDDNVTWLTVVNDLLAAIGYAGVWSDHNGVLRAQVYQTPSTRSPEWYMTDDPAVTLLTERRKRTRDYYDAPNRWVFYQNNATDSAQPDATNGLRFEYVNLNDGPTSVNARGGRVITKVMGVDAADAASLQAQAQVTIDADTLIPTSISIDTAPFPLAWHFDRIAVSDAALGVALDVLVSSWTQNLDGSDTSWEWSVLG